MRFVFSWWKQIENKITWVLLVFLVEIHSCDGVKEGVDLLYRGT